METAAEGLAGLTLDEGWVVLGPAPPELAIGGGLFAATYIVKSSDGRMGFLKALDYSRASESPDPSILLESLTAAFNFEREVLRRCKDRGLDKVVTAIADGKIQVSAGLQGTVQYLIFELHDGDASRQSDISRRFNLAGTLRALHHIASGLGQLHGEGIAHQNLRPATVWNYGAKNKIAELGGAASRERSSTLESGPDLSYDPCYASPEILYGYQDTDWNRRCYGCDLYLLGSMVVFFFTGASATALLRAELHDKHAWDHWTGSYDDVLPYVHDAFEHVLSAFDRHIDESVAPEIRQVVAQLCNPDPRLRGHPLNKLTKGNPYSLERYISTFDLLAHRAEISYWRRRLQ